MYRVDLRVLACCTGAMSLYSVRSLLVPGHEEPPSALSAAALALLVRFGDSARLHESRYVPPVDHVVMPPS